MCVFVCVCVHACMCVGGILASGHSPLFFLSLALPGWDEHGAQVLHLGRDLSSTAGDRAPIALWLMWGISS